MWFSALPALPVGPGLLPKWQLLVSGLAVFNSVQNLCTLKLTRRIYSRAPSEVTALQSRTFAIWTFFTAIVRAYCAYHIHEKPIYDITIWSYIVALFHFASEWHIFRSADFRGRGLLGPLMVAPISLLWMIYQYDYYIQK